MKSLDTLVKLFTQLNPDAQASLIQFAEFLSSRSENLLAISPQEIPTEPLAIPRPAEETVISAIKRLSNTYPMLDSDKLLHETAQYMTQHIMQGRLAADVIDDLEELFRNSYNSYKQE